MISERGGGRKCKRRGREVEGEKLDRERLSGLSVSGGGWVVKFYLVG